MNIPADKTVIGIENNEPDAQAPLSSSTSFNRGDYIGRFEIERQLGIGGMGTVYLAHDPDLRRHVAIKVLNVGSVGDESAQARFRAEAQAAGKLNHPNVVAVHEIGNLDGLMYIVMEFLPNRSLADLLQNNPSIDLVAAIQIIITATKGLAAAHCEGLIHRDIKPANLMIGYNGEIKLADFGLALTRHSDSSADLTQAGQILGTPYFMSPEQCQGNDLDERSDLYSLGATFFMLLTGQSPFEHAGSTMAVLAAHLKEPPPDPKSLVSNIPDPCVRIVRRLLAKAPDDRYPTADLLLRDLEALLKVLEDPNSAREIRWRGATQIPRETMELPSEKTGQFPISKNVNNNVVREITPDSNKKKIMASKTRSWFADVTKSLQNSPHPDLMHTEVVSSNDSDSDDKSQLNLCSESTGSQRSISTPNHKNEVFSGRYGQFILYWPENISPSEVEEVQEWLQILANKFRRIANDTSNPNMKSQD